MSVSYFTQELCNCVISKMATGGHFGFQSEDDLQVDKLHLE